jgi:transposase
VRPPSPPHEMGGGTRRLDPWAVGSLAPFLPPATSGRPRLDDRRVIDGIFWVLRTGAPWRDLPARYGKVSTVASRFYRWRRAGVLGRAPRRSSALGRRRRPTRLVLALRRQHGGAGAPARRRGQGGAARPTPRPLPRRVLDRAARARRAGREARDLRLDRRRAATTGGATRPPGRRCRQAPWSGPPRLRPDRIAGDRGYSGGAARDGLRRRGIGSVIPQPRNQRPWAMADWSAYRERNKVERLSCRLEPLRGDLVRSELDGAPAPSRARLRRRSCATRGDPRVASRHRRTDGRALFWPRRPRPYQREVRG